MELEKSPRPLRDRGMPLDVEQVVEGAGQRSARFAHKRGPVAAQKAVLDGGGAEGVNTGAADRTFKRPFR